MSGKSKHRSKGRQVTPRRPDKASPRGEELAAAKRRAAAAKAALAGVGTFVFAAGMILARHSYAGHPKQPTTALAASPRFVKIVKQNLLHAGVVAPAQAPPGAATAAS